MVKPNFIIGGTSAGGTSFLTAAIIQHPDIYISKRMRPEPHYFYKSWEYQKGFQYYLDTWFSEYLGQKAIGERSSSYIFGGEEVAEKIYKDLPDIKLIFIFRNPVERTWANYRVTVIQGLEELSFEDALKNEKQRIVRFVDSKLFSCCPRTQLLELSACHLLQLSNKLQNLQS